MQKVSATVNLDIPASFIPTNSWFYEFEAFMHEVFSGWMTIQVDIIKIFNIVAICRHHLLDPVWFNKNQQNNRLSTDVQGVSFLIEVYEKGLRTSKD